MNRKSNWLLTQPPKAIYRYTHNNTKLVFSKYRYGHIWENGKLLYNNLSENDFFQETIRINHLLPNNLQKCLTIKWPTNLNFGTQSFVSTTVKCKLIIKMLIQLVYKNNFCFQLQINFDYTMIRQILIFLHLRGDSEILVDIKN